ncbi:MAG: hypothetical protein B5M56_00180 [Desulfococcus sp. 4484_241]|nr:MAG: hypothetical protein B5M56_00180 [Desulfococcus sp. 4484_241]
MNSRFILKDAFKKFTLDQDKALDPEETVRRFRQKAKQTGINILKHTKRIDSGRLDIPVYFSVCGPDATAVTGATKQMGKGATPEQAEASAVMELAERFSFFSFRANSENFVTATYEDVKNDAIPFSMILQSVNDRSDDPETSQIIFGDIPMKWARGYNLTRDREVFVPFDWFFMINEFNGPSAGNCPEEAIVQGICEIVERHVSSIISREKRQVPIIEQDSVTDPVVKDLLAKYRAAGIKVFISDFSLDMGIPTVGVLAYDPATFPHKSEIVWTAGTAPAPHKAMSRALTETAQLAGDFNSGSNYVASGLPKFKTLDEARFVMEPGHSTSIGSLPDLSDLNFRIEIERCVSALAKKGMEVLLIDTTHPDLQIPAFYTIVPGAHFRERAAETSVAMFSAKLIAENSPPYEALEKLEQIERVVPDRYYTAFYMGYCHLNMNDPSSALECFSQAMDRKPTREALPTICSYMGVCLKEMEQFEKAIEVLAKGEFLDSERTDIHNMMGFCFFKLGNHERAIECFKKAININPGSAIDYANIGANYRAMGNREKAVEYYLMALEIDPSIEFAREHLDAMNSE